MEGVGSRQSRAASRYASGPSAAAVFNGPVRKWKKQWVTSHSSNQSNGNSGRNHAPPLLLRRWTPLSASASAADEPRKRRFRYAPVVPIEKGNTEAVEKVNVEARTSTKNQSNDVRIENDSMLEKPSPGYTSIGEAREPSEDRADSNKTLAHGFHTEDKM